MVLNVPNQLARHTSQSSNRARNKRRTCRLHGRPNLLVESLESRTLLAGTWTALAHGAPAGIGTMELLSDGTVMAQGGGVSKNWYKLTPDSTGSYVNGTWSSLASMSLERLYTATNVLKDGRVFELGGEYSGPTGSANWTNTGEIYNPVSNTWSGIPNFPQSQFGDDPSMLLPDGRVLAGYLSGPQTYIYDPVSNTWSTAGTKLHGDRSDEETWVKLPDDSVLSYDVFTQGASTAQSQRYIPSSNTWVDAGTVPVLLSGSSVGSELGPGFLLPDGRAFFLGATGHTAFYTPSTNTWTAGANIPGGQAADDNPGAMMPNGKILVAVDTALFNPPTRIYEFDPTLNSFTDVTPATPNLSGSPAYITRMLMLPSGQVLFTPSSSQLYVYTPTGAPQTAWKPTVTGVVPNGSNFTLTGTQINGISAGASYGDDAEMDTNYPIIELKNAGGTVYFARTFNWSSTGVATGSASVSTDFSLPTGIPNGTYSLYVVANGIASDPFSFTVGTVTGSADLSVTNNGPAPANEGDNVTYTVTVTNNGPDTPSDVVLTDTLGANLIFVSATSSQGTFSQSGGVITFSIGAVGANQTVTVTVTAQATEDGNLTNSATASSSTGDPNTGNNTAVGNAAVAETPIIVSDPIIRTGRKVNNLTVATFTHANGVEPASAFTAIIDWGDGKTSTGTVALSGGSYTVNGSHTYPKGGSHTITTTVTESDSPPNSGGAPSSFSSFGGGLESSNSIVLQVPNTSISQPARVDAVAPPAGAEAGLSSGVSDQFLGQDLVNVSPAVAVTIKKKAALPRGPKLFIGA